MSQVSIIIPTLNEATNLGRTLRQLTLLNPPPDEVIVVDGGSQDQTVTVAKRIFESFNQTLNVQFLLSQQPGRSLQMNYGASAATGDIICFLHADTWVPDDLITVINKTLAEPTVACGGFISLMSGYLST
jgi:glycosyltransferase involved in cell wall biosynthesis